MDTLMNIGPVISKGSREELGKLIDSVLKSCYNYEASENTSIKALDLCREVFEVKNVTVANSTFIGNAVHKAKKVLGRDHK